jgi:uncharacterized protein (TIGR00255 family)
MSVASMTGFARSAGSTRRYQWAWEVKSVNAKGLDVRLRLPPGFDGLEPNARAAIGQTIARGTCYATLSVIRSDAAPSVVINTAILHGLLDAIRSLPLDASVRPVSLDGLLNLRGVVEISEPDVDEIEQTAVQVDIRAGLSDALAALLAMRRSEGEALGAVVETRLANMTRLTAAAEGHPGRTPDAIKARLTETLAQLVGANSGLDPQRLYQEAVLLAAKADIREELDRLTAHIAAVRDLLAKGGAIGRRLDFLAQELSREANTLCSKSSDVTLTAIGLELKTEIEQFREQIQNIE